MQPSGGYNLFNAISAHRLAQDRIIKLAVDNTEPDYIGDTYCSIFDEEINRFWNHCWNCCSPCVSSRSNLRAGIYQSSADKRFTCFFGSCRYSVDCTEIDIGGARHRSIDPSFVFKRRLSRINPEACLRLTLCRRD